MSQLHQTPFFHVNSTLPGFNSTSGSSGTYALESTGVREWSGPSNRSVRVASQAATDAYIIFGTSDMVVSTTAGILVLGGTVESFHVRAGWTHIGIASSTDVVYNVSLGTGS